MHQTFCSYISVLGSTARSGARKEAFFFRMPCVTLREETGWVETE